jgi:DNA-binding IclR family transcriptional regulator
MPINGRSLGVAVEDATNPSGTLLSLQRGLRLLETIALHNGEATAKVLSHQTGIKIGTCYHVLRTLEEEGYVVRMPGGRYGLGSRVAFLYDNLRVALSPAPELLEIMAQLHVKIGETTYISGWYGDTIVLQRYLEGSQAVHVRSLEIGYAGFAHARASGKAMLAYLSEDRIRSYFSMQALTPRTATTITNLDLLIDHLRGVARAGVALDNEEFSEGVSCIATTIFDRRRFPIGAYTVSLPSIRLAARRTVVTNLLLEAAMQASATLGFREAYPPPSALLKTHDF